MNRKLLFIGILDNEFGLSVDEVSALLLFTLECPLDPQTGENVSVYAQLNKCL